jgi:acylpyruvate hydrolase
MKLITYQTNQISLGSLQGDQIVDLAQAYRAAVNDPRASFPDDMITLLQDGETGLARARTALAYAAGQDGPWLLSPDEVSLLPPVLRPGKIICLGRNYAAHAKEGGADPLEYPILFFKPASALVGAGGTVVVPPVTEKADYEGELAVIIGRTCKQVTAGEALAYVAGYTVANDVSARDLQRRTPQWAAGKMLDTFCPLGPALVTRDEIPDPGDLAIRTTLNGQLMQDSHTGLMIFDVPFIISYISQIATLEPGDIILTGTPDGVGYPRNPPVFLQDGDTISVEVEGVGTLTNTVRKY